MSIKALEYHLKPLLPFLDKEGVTEICINQPFEAFVEANQVFERHEVATLSFDYLENLVKLVAAFDGQVLSSESPILSSVLPNGCRFQCVIPPACEAGHIVICIRKHQPKSFALEDYRNLGVFNLSQLDAKQNGVSKLKLFYQQQDYLNFIKTAIFEKQNVIISGGTGTGKTTFLNACLKCIPQTERLVTLEDVREVKLEHQNRVHLLNPLSSSVCKISMLDLLKSTLRLRPDRIILSELRGPEAFAFLQAANSGHPGSMTTVHSDTPKGCFEQLAWMVQQAGTTAKQSEILDYVKRIIPIVIQLKRSTHPNRFMEITEVYYCDA